MRALITGIEGFTGQYVAAELEAAGYQVFGLCNRAHPGTTRIFPADLQDARALKTAITKAAPDVVVHLAALAFVAHGDAAAFYKVNVIGTRNLLEALAQAAPHARRVVLASSANVYGNQQAGMLDEQTPPNPANDYAVSKLAMEYMARLWHDRLPMVITRPFNYTGVGQSPAFLLPKIVAHFQRRAERIELGNLDVCRDFSDVRAVAQAYRRLLEAPAAIGQTVNLCSGRTVSLREVLTLTEQQTGHPMKIDVNPAFVRQNEVHTLGGSPDLLRRLIGDWHSPPLEETLAWMLEG
ncbi:MAG: GDP-mannose 4,6-dehydratase [Zoogloeaceae bacterium]|jgi:nucleoside-diphosphate-sugar epimerase|nr:GDP-mannose 4,6-dehydratase [Zoogloeaceae bacterium]